MKKEEFYFESSDNKTEIRAIYYKPEKEIKAILQIAHGMTEFIDRYDNFASFLCDNGFLVVGNDHLGHGKSVNSIDDLGYMGKGGHNFILEDLHKLTLMTKEKYKGLPYFFLGHSMGSFFARYYLIKYPNELDACIIMGTGQQTPATINGGKVLCRMVVANKGWRHRSRTINATAVGAYNKKFEPSNSTHNWLTKDDEIVSKYDNEPLCNFVFTVDGFYNLFSVIGEIIEKNNYSKMNKDIPILITSGEDDPVGNFSKDPKDVYEKFKEVGMKNVSLKLYPSDRHEILNELDKDVVYKDILNWLEGNIK